MNIRYFVLLFLPVLFLSRCGTTGPKTDYGTAGNAELRALLTPNDPNLSFPIYSTFDEIAPLFNQTDGRTYVVNFWATWCRPCITEMPYFERLARETADGDVQVIMVSLDKPRDIRTKLKDFVSERPLKLPIVSFTDNFYDGWLYKVDESWTGSIPVTLIYRDGKQKFNKGSISSYRELQGLVRTVE